MLDTFINNAVEPVRWLLILVIAATLATTVLFFMSPADGGVSGTSGPGPANTPATQASVNIDRIVNRHLFGIASAVPSDTEPVQETIEETRLPLELNGVFVAEEPEYSAAIIAQRGKPGTLYNIGDSVPGNAKLVEVHAGYVILRRAGVRETLRFPELKDQFAADVADGGPADAPFPGGSTTTMCAACRPGRTGSQAGPGGIARRPAADGPPRNAREFVDQYRDKLAEDPAGALSELGVVPVATDSAQGYKLGNLADSPYLSNTGLQAGDVVLSVNGKPVGDVRQDRLQIDSIVNQGSARLEIQRGSRRFFVTASLR